MPGYYLNTKLYDEGKQDGLAICGINDAGESGPGGEEEFFGPSFFSDERYPGGPSTFRRSIVAWFSRWGHPLARRDAGPFERSIVQFNWLRDQSPNISDKSIYEECCHNKENLAFHLANLRPRLLFLMSVKMFDALQADACADLRALLGPAEPRTASERNTRFRVEVAQFGRVTVVGLPHPNARLRHSDVDDIGSIVSPIIAAYRAARRFGSG